LYRISGYHGDESDPAPSFRDPSRWYDLPTALGAGDSAPEVAKQIKAIALLLGDEAAGLAIMVTVTPPGLELPRGPGHSHHTDTWRMSVRGSMHMGPLTFRETENFRFQVAGVSYGGDDLAWGPEGGWGLTLFGDRRGCRMTYVAKDLQGEADFINQGMEAWFGVERDDSLGPMRGLSTSLGSVPRSGAVEGSFTDVDEWHPGGPGMSMSQGLLGDPFVGPVVALLRWDEAGELEGDTFGTEVLHLVVDGSLRIGVHELQRGDMLVVPAGEAHPGIAARSHGCRMLIVLGDRSGLGCGNPEPEWVRRLTQETERLRAALPVP
jgi:hypothetical protein